MMLGLHGRDSEAPVGAYQVAEKLGKTVTELGAIPYREYLEWEAYFTAKHAIEDTQRRANRG